MIRPSLHGTATEPSFVTETAVKGMLSGVNSASSSVDLAFDLMSPQVDSEAHASGPGP
jgi:hypothetical protein